jgi:hypothetical protein
MNHLISWEEAFFQRPREKTLHFLPDQPKLINKLTEKQSTQTTRRNTHDTYGLHFQPDIPNEPEKRENMLYNGLTTKKLTQ